MNALESTSTSRISKDKSLTNPKKYVGEQKLSIQDSFTFCIEKLEELRSTLELECVVHVA